MALGSKIWCAKVNGPQTLKIYGPFTENIRSHNGKYTDRIIRFAKIYGPRIMMEGTENIFYNSLGTWIK